MTHEIEAVARALYEAEDDAQIWEREPEILKEEYRFYARAALTLLDRHRGEKQAAAEIATVPYAA